MIKRLKLALAVLGVALLISSFIPQPASASIASDKIKDGVNTAAGKDNADKPNSLTNLIAKIVNILSVLIGAIAVIMLIYGGFRYVTSAGNDAGVQAAKNTILYAIIGLIIVAMAQIIVKFVLTNVGEGKTSSSTSRIASTWLVGSKDPLHSQDS